MSGSPTNTSPKRTSEFSVVLALGLGFGLVGIDRYLITTMFPVIARDLSLGYGAIGTITGALSIAWGLSALWMGNAADRIGRRPILIGSLLVFSTLIGLSGLAVGLSSLLAIRVMMGFADGAFTPASIAATLDASAEKRRGLNLGLQQAAHLLFGLGFAPLLVAWLLHIIDWRWIFSLFVIPGFLLAMWVSRVVPRREISTTAVAPRAMLDDFRAVLAFTNIRVLMLLMLAWLTCLISLSAFLPSYMLYHLKLGFGQMSGVMSAIGFGGALGTILLPALSDKIGRKPVVLAGTIGAFCSIVALSLCGPLPLALFICLFFAMGCIMALITLTVGVLCEETVPSTLGATASGVVIAAGELFGGGIAPMVVGQVAQRLGIEHILWIPMVVLIVALLVATVLRETRTLGPRPGLEAMPPAVPSEASITF